MGMGDEVLAKMPTPESELARQIMSSLVPKNEREWWAHRKLTEFVEAAEAVCAFDWSDNDEDAVEAIARLRKLLPAPPSQEEG
jgi:hypothetical protein